MGADFMLVSRADDADVARAASAVEQVSWAGLDFLNYTRASFDHYGSLLKHFAEYQMCVVDPVQKYVLAAGNCVPLYSENLDVLPDEGWDWAVRTAAATQHMKPNMLVGLAISVPKMHRGKGYARLLIDHMRSMAVERGLHGPAFPVRPSAKHQFPAVNIHDYTGWYNDSGSPFDPWLRSHLAMGGTLIGPCERSMVVEEPVAFWENWIGKSIEKSGPLIVTGGLVPVDINLEKGVGHYIEPNVWVRHYQGIQ